MTRLLLRWPAWMLASLALVAIADRTRPVGWFVVNQLQLDYQVEFVRRGLVGEVLRVLGVPRNVTTAWWMGWMFAAALAAASWAFFVRMGEPVTVGADNAAPSTAGRDRARSSTVTPLMVAFLLSPATFLQAGYDFGRLDAVLVGLTMVLLLSVESGWEALGLDVVVVSAATLVHEIFVVTSAPFIAAGFLFVAASHPTLRARLIVRATVVVLTSIVAGLLVVRFGNMDTFAFEQYVAMLTSQGRLGGGDPTALAVAFRSLDESVAYAASRYASKPLAPAVAAVGITAITWVFSWMAIGRRGHRGQRVLVAGFFLAAAAAPLALVPVGHDYGRWLALSIANTMMAAAVVSHATGTTARPWIGWLALLAAAGPFGSNIVLPWWG